MSKRKEVFKSLEERTPFYCFLDGKNLRELGFLCHNSKEKLWNYEGDIYWTKTENTHHAYPRKRAHLLPNDSTQDIQLIMDY